MAETRNPSSGQQDTRHAVTTRVINLHGRRDDPEFDPDLNPDVVYLGNRQWWGRGRLLDGHPLANPYRISKYSREVALAMYRRDLLARTDLEEQLDALRGRVLACWCKPLVCHCDIVAAEIDKRASGGSDA